MNWIANMFKRTDNQQTTPKTAEQQIQEWVDKNDTSKPLCIKDCSLQTLPPLPQNVKSLYLVAVDLETLELPASLETLLLQNLTLTTVPSLPSTLTNLTYQYVTIPSLPTHPPMLTHLEIERMNIDALPDFPASLETLKCVGLINVTSLPALPSTLRNFCCTHIKLNSLPPLPDSIQVLDLRNMPMRIIPTFPQSLTECRIWLVLDSFPSPPPNVRMITMPENTEAPLTLKMCHFHDKEWNGVCKETKYIEAWKNHCIHNETPLEYYNKWKEAFDKNNQQT